jgi:hypothetical protein
VSLKRSQGANSPGQQWQFRLVTDPSSRTVALMETSAASLPSALSPVVETAAADEAAAIAKREKGEEREDK